MVPRRETDLNESGDETNSPESVGTAKSKVVMTRNQTLLPHFPHFHFPIRTAQKEKEIEIPWV